MTSLSKLIEFKNSLVTRYDDIFKGINEVVDMKAIDLKIVEIENFTVDYKQDLHTIISLYTNILSENEKIAAQLKTLIDKVELDIKTTAKEQFSNITYQSHFASKEMSEFPTINEDLYKTLRVKMHQYSDWRYPGLQYNIRDKKYVDCMTACDPLYLTCENIEDSKSIIENYPEIYQARLRIYTNRNWNDLPIGQFGYVLAWNYFEYCSMAEIEEYLKNTMPLLRPGGIVMFSFNNCDLPGSAKVAEEGRMNYNSASAIKDICDNLGYDIISFNDIETHHWNWPWISWVEIKLPGELNTIKAHQVLGKIIPK
jgi:signal recognition particle subunit SEC65